jgi:hypothetical protein
MTKEGSAISQVLCRDRNRAARQGQEEFVVVQRASRLAAARRSKLGQRRCLRSPAIRLRAFRSHWQAARALASRSDPAEDLIAESMYRYSASSAAAPGAGRLA